MNNKYDFKKLYLDWLKDNIEQSKINDNIYRITLPFLNRDNDLIELYVIKKGNNDFLLTDDSYTINDLQFSGFDPLSSKKRKDILYSIVLSHGVNLSSSNELYVNCSLEDLALKKHMLAQCMLKINDMFYLSKTNVQSLFVEDVQQFFDINKINYIDNINIIGKSKLPTHFDFAITRSNNAPERLIKVINNLDSAIAKTIIFAWNDTKETRKPDTMLYTFIRDTNKKISSSSINALKEYNIEPALWTQRDKYVSKLSA